MPFETTAHHPKHVAVIGGGISGMGAAHMLAPEYRVTLFEAEQRLGGHARTIVAGKNGDQPVDTGFLVFNYANYPLMAELFSELSVPVVKSNSKTLRFSKKRFLKFFFLGKPFSQRHHHFFYFLLLFTFCIFLWIRYSC